MDVLKQQKRTTALCHKFTENELVYAKEAVRDVKKRLSDLRHAHHQEAEKYAAGLAAAKTYLQGTSICPVLLNNMHADIVSKQKQLAAIDAEVKDALQELKQTSVQLAKIHKQAEFMQAKHQSSHDALNTHINQIEERAIAELPQGGRGFVTW